MQEKLFFTLLLFYFLYFTLLYIRRYTYGFFPIIPAPPSAGLSLQKSPRGWQKAAQSPREALGRAPGEVRPRAARAMRREAGEGAVGSPPPPGRRSVRSSRSCTAAGGGRTGLRAAGGCCCQRRREGNRPSRVGSAAPERDAQGVPGTPLQVREAGETNPLRGWWRAGDNTSLSATLVSTSSGRPSTHHFYHLVVPMVRGGVGATGCRSSTEPGNNRASCGTLERGWCGSWGLHNVSHGGLPTHQGGGSRGVCRTYSCLWALLIFIPVLVKT